MHRIQKSIRDSIARAKFVAVQPDDTVSAAVEGMKAEKTDCALVVENERLIGIFTERDFLNRISAEDLDPGQTTMRDVMTASPETLRSHNCITYAINRMAIGGYRNIPIVDRDGRPTSVLDVRLVMMHLIKVFAEIEEAGPYDDDDEWIDIGGG